jgi:hypothetical protein
MAQRPVHETIQLFDSFPQHNYSTSCLVKSPIPLLVAVASASSLAISSCIRAFFGDDENVPMHGGLAFAAPHWLMTDRYSIVLDSIDSMETGDRDGQTRIHHAYAFSDETDR